MLPVSGETVLSVGRILLPTYRNTTARFAIELEVMEMEP